jgi:uncharacterized membrane protein (UPF0127 family)
MTPPSRLARLPVRTLPGGLQLATAATPRSRFLGLAWLDAIPVDWALLLPRCRSVHTFWMRFDLDLVWLDAGGRVMRIDAAVPRRRTRSCRRADGVVETRSGRGADFASALGGA